MNFIWFVGIDVSKKTLDASIFDEKRSINNFEHIVVSNDKEGYKELMKWVRGKDMKLKDVLFAMEFTGPYSDGLEFFLSGRHLCYTMLATTIIKHYSFGGRDKSDKIDSAKIADYIYHYRERMQLRQLPSESIQELKALKSERKFYVRHRTDCENRLKVAKTTSERRHLEKTLKFYNEMVKGIEDDIAELICTEKDLYESFSNLNSIPGIGFVNAANIIANTQNFTSFETARQYARYIGVAPSGHTSGTSVRWRPRPYLHCDLQAKADLSIAALRAIEVNVEIRTFYERKLGGKTNDKDVQRKALNAVKFKLIQMMFAIGKQHRRFTKNRIERTVA